MSSVTDSSEDNDYTPWNELTTARQRVALTITDVHGPTTFNRPDLQEDAEDADDLNEVIDNVDRVLISLKYTRLLNCLVDDGYLIKEVQGGTNPLILDIEYDSNRDTRSAAPYGNTSALHTIVDQVCDREGISRDVLDEVQNEYDFNEVRDAVNRAVGHRVLRTYSDPSEYRSTKKTYSLVESKVDNSRK
jgi:hypothetical protein